MKPFKAVLGCLFAGVSPLASFAAQQPNIILFLVDDMGWQDTSVPFYQTETLLNKRYNTPNMERLAEMGVKFTNAYACSVSTPTRCSLMTGMNAARHHVTNWTLNYGNPTDAKGNIIPPDWNFNGIQPDTVTTAHNIQNSTIATTLPQLLRQNGYYTIHCGKAHFGAKTTPGANPLAMGFDVNIAGGANGAPASYLGTKNFGQGRPMEVLGMEKYWGQDIFLTEAITREALAALEKPIADGKPFYLYMSQYAIHVPYDADERFVGKYRNRYDELLKANLKESEACFAALIEGMDKSLGDLLDFLDKHPKVAANTVVLFMSDNGGQGQGGVRQGRHNRDQNYPLRAGKGSAFMGGVREPMIVYWPGVTPKGVSTDAPVIIEDFFPTILDIAGVNEYETVQTIDGISFVDILRNPDKARERTLVWHFPNLWGETQNINEGYGAFSAIMEGDYHLIYSWERQSLRLYNIREDISEQNDLAASMPEKVKELSRKLTKELKRYGAQRPMLKATNVIIPYPDGSLH